MQPLVSICLPNLNTHPYLEARMESIFSQTLTEWELIICDGHSDDGAWEYFQQFKNDSRITLYQMPRGEFQAWNDCVLRARGEYVYIATSDDTFYPTCLEKMSGALARMPEIDLAICRYDRIDRTGKIITAPDTDLQRLYGDWLQKPHRRSGVAEYLVGMCLGCNWETITASLCRRRLFNKAGYFSTDYGSLADVPWRLAACLHTDLIYLPEALATWRVYPEQLTAHLPVDWRRMQRDYAAEIIDRHLESIPVEWRNDPDWRKKLMRHVEGLYQQSFKLDRMNLRRAPGAFLRGAWRALCHEPGYLARRLLTGLSWEAGEDDDLAHFQRLVDEWHVPWPPVEISDR